ncbi:MAG: nucleotidyltransferase domain-containing protein [Ignavibacteriaceae bacterium]|jgi:predicted nucleotidyltransferase|nr:nucleotidyltransferase domain-containing protein [Ignavibacteriaceae bacterium]
MYKRNDLINIINEFINLISVEFPVKYLYLFGSYANDKADENSDIDIAVVSDNFQGSRFIDREKLGKYIIKSSYDLEVHPFKTEDFTEDDPFVKQIIKSGQKII